MTRPYRLHFVSSRSKNYPQAVELAMLAYGHEIRGEDEDAWHIATFAEDQIDLMAFLYNLIRELSVPKAYEMELNDFTNSHPKPITEDMERACARLESEGYLDHYDSGNFVMATKEPEEPIPEYRRIRDLISEGNYEEAIAVYYSTLGQEYYGVLTGELISLKRLANAPLTGRDLLCFRSPSSRKGLIESNLSEYVDCIDTVLANYKKAGYKLPLDVIIEYAPTMQQMIEKQEHDWHQGVYLWDGEFKRDHTPVTIDTFDAYTCPEGRLFDRYPDQVRHCEIIEFRENWDKYAGLWTPYSPGDYQREILDKGLHPECVKFCETTKARN
jgi:hypothetical protein